MDSDAYVKKSILTPAQYWRKFVKPQKHLSRRRESRPKIEETRVVFLCLKMISQAINFCNDASLIYVLSLKFCYGLWA